MRQAAAPLLIAGLTGCTPPPAAADRCRCDPVHDRRRQSDDRRPGRAGRRARLSAWLPAGFESAEFYQLFNQDQANLEDRPGQARRFPAGAWADQDHQPDTNRTGQGARRVRRLSRFSARDLAGDDADIPPNKTTTVTIRPRHNGIGIKSEPVPRESRLVPDDGVGKQSRLGRRAVPPAAAPAAAGTLLEHLVRGSTAGLTPFSLWADPAGTRHRPAGVGQIRDLLGGAGCCPTERRSTLRLTSITPRPLDLPETARNSTVYLMLPSRQPGGVEYGGAGTDGDRRALRAAEHEAIDTNVGYQCAATVPIGKLRLRFALEGESRAGPCGIGLPRIVEVRADRPRELDEAFIPPLLFSRRLAGARRFRDAAAGPAASPGRGAGWAGVRVRDARRGGDQPTI